MNKEITLNKVWGKVDDGEPFINVRVSFKDERMSEYFVQWFEEVGRESFEASLVDIKE